jgi:aminopeptidase N
MLWLTLALLTPGFDEDHKAEYFNELSGYTSPEYGFEIRQLAFEYLKEAFTFTDTNLKDLVNACVHHSWQFRNFARNLLNELLNKEHYLERVRAITKELKGEDLRYLKQKLEAK